MSRTGKSIGTESRLAALGWRRREWGAGEVTADWSGLPVYSVFPSRVMRMF